MFVGGLGWQPIARSNWRETLKCNFGLHVATRQGKAPTTSENNLFFVFTISALISLVLSRFCRSKKYVRDIYQLDWKRQQSVGPDDHPGRESDRGTPYMSIEVVRVGSGWGSQVSGKIRKIMKIIEKSKFLIFFKFV